MYRSVSAVWKIPPEIVRSQFEAGIKPLIVSMTKCAPVRFFFRADDVGIPGKKFLRLMEIFHHFQTPLSLAVVPAWVTLERWEIYQALDRLSPELWCWHQHGWRHLNHELQGKKQEFGPARSEEQIERDILSGRDKLKRILHDRFTPVFTPPWNRCDVRALAILKEHGYLGVSRHWRSLPPAPDGLPDFPVMVDLHTRREATPEAGWKALREEFSASAAAVSGICGIMIHHQRMNAAAFLFLELLLHAIQDTAAVQCLHLGDLVHHA